MRRIMMSFLVSILVCMTMAAAGYSAPKTRLLQEDLGADQRLENFRGLPVIISEKTYRAVLSPETIMPGSKTTLYFNLIISNPTQAPLAFSLDHISTRSPQNELKLLAAEEAVAENRKFYSKEEYGISADQEKELMPFVEEKMERFREKLMKNQVIESKSNCAGIIAVQIPFGTESFLIEVVTGTDRHFFKFNVGEF